MKIVVSATRYDAELRRWLTECIEKRTAEIVDGGGVPVEVYKERLAGLRALRDVLAELPAILNKAKD